MKRLLLDHVTTYSYAQPVVFGPHRMMFRPRDSHDLRLIWSDLIIEPAGEIFWVHDVFGNSITNARFAGEHDHLLFRSRCALELYPAKTLAFQIEPYAAEYPFSYGAELTPDLARCHERHYPDPDALVDQWVRRFLQPGINDTLTLLNVINKAIPDEFAYNARFEPGTQEPTETLASKSGTCRDFALFMMEAVRALGFAARFVTGYLYDPALDPNIQQNSDVQGAGATHAWLQVFLPGAGWVEFDPTNASSGGGNLIRVGVCRDPSQAIPVSGSFTGPGTAFLGLEVDVTITDVTATWEGPPADAAA